MIQQTKYLNTPRINRILNDQRPDYFAGVFCLFFKNKKQTKNTGKIYKILFNLLKDFIKLDIFYAPGYIRTS